MAPDVPKSSLRRKLVAPGAAIGRAAARLCPGLRFGPRVNDSSAAISKPSATHQLAFMA
jgi:hypothetical protein